MGTSNQTRSSTSPGQDPTVLREEAYADDSRLDVRRRTHQLYTVDPVDFGRWTLERIPWRGEERVLDMGCGPGELLRAMARHQQAQQRRRGTLIGFDFSTGMITEAVEASSGLPVQFFIGDAQAIPFPEATFDVVMARHMLYHVPDIDRAIAEGARVLKAGGTFLATTNSGDTMPQYWALHRQAAERFPSLAQAEQITHPFCLENGPGFFERCFGRVETHTLPGTLRFPAAQPMVDYFASARALTMRPDHSEAEWQAVLDFVRAEAEATIARHGHFDITKVTGAVVGIKGA